MTDPTQLPLPGRQELEGRQCLSAGDRERLRQIAVRAEPFTATGPTADGFAMVAGDTHCWLQGFDQTATHAGRLFLRRFGEFYNTFSPPTVLSLLDALDAAEADRDAARAELDCVRTACDLFEKNSEGAAALQEETFWVRKKLGLPLDAPFTELQASLSRLREENAALRGEGKP